MAATWWKLAGGLATSVALLLVAACALSLLSTSDSLSLEKGAAGAAPQGRADAAIESVRARYDKVGLFGLAVLADGTVCDNAASGERLFGSGELLPRSLDTRYHWASMTKSMTATLMAIAIEDGLVPRGWDATLGEVFPAARGSAYERATLKQLASHQAGFQRDVPNGYAPYAAGGGTLREQRQRCVASALENGAAYPPGSAFGYSNWGYVVLGHLVETLLGSTWEELLLSRLFLPLGVPLSREDAFGVPQGAEQPVGHWAHFPFNPRGQTRLLGAQAGFFFDEPLRGPVGVFSGPLRAMAAYLAWHVRCHNGQDTLDILSAEGCRTLHTPANASIHSDMALGWFCTRGGFGREDHPYCQHSGTKGYFFTRMTIVPALEKAFLVGLNQCDHEETGTDEAAMVEALGALDGMPPGCEAAAARARL
jgi:CubicO group peptidase (beta-lactamase class C family)